MQKRILKNNMISRIITGLLTVAVCMSVFAYSLGRTMDRQVISRTRLLARVLEESPEKDPGQVLADMDSEINGRITFVDNAGKVVFDSDYYAGDMENHSGRREIARAMEAGEGSGHRYSDTEKKTVYYSAVRVSDKGAVRLGITSSSVAGDILARLSPFIALGIGAVILLVFFISRSTTRRIVRAVESYDADSGRSPAFEELSGFVGKIKSQKEIIDRQMQSLTDEKIKFQNIFMNIKEGIMVCDARGSVAQANREAGRIFSFSALPRKFPKTGGATRLRQAVSRALSGQTVRLSFEKDGKYYRRTVSPNFTPEGREGRREEEKGAVIILSDITRQTENERNRRRFTDNVTHELKTPLTSILGYSQLIASGMAREEDVKKFAGVVESSASNLLEMINDIINISNLESGYGFEKEVIPLDEILRDAVESETPAARAAGVSIETHADKVDIFADEGRMYQLIHNLISNGVKYNVPGGKVEVFLRKEGDRAALTVSDTGIGISPGDIDRIFERFYVADKSRNKNTSSTGLGLSIVKHVVKAHGGYITVDSEPGRGSVFTVKLPLSLPDCPGNF